MRSRIIGYVHEQELRHRALVARSGVYRAYTDCLDCLIDLRDPTPGYLSRFGATCLHPLIFRSTTRSPFHIDFVLIFGASLIPPKCAKITFLLQTCRKKQGFAGSRKVWFFDPKIDPKKH